MYTYINGEKYKNVQCTDERHMKQGLHYHLERVNLYYMLVRWIREVA